MTFFLVDDAPGHGPVLHRHPYTETWVVLAGEVAIWADGEVVEGRPEDIVTVSAGTAHKFRATGTERLRMVCIHASPRMIQEDLPDDDPDWLSG